MKIIVIINCNESNNNNNNNTSSEFQSSLNKLKYKNLHKNLRETTKIVKLDF